MKILDRYIAVTIIVSTLLALLVLLVLDGFFSFVTEIGNIGRGQYGLPQALLFVLLTLPNRASEMMPMATVLGALLGLGALANHSELVAIRAAGISTQRIVWSALRAGLMVVVAAIVVGEFIAPPSEQYAQRMRALAESQHIVWQSDDGFWARDGMNFVNIKQILPGGRLNGIDIYQFDPDHRLREATYARTAIYMDKKWWLQGVKQSYIGKDGVVTREQGNVTWDALLSPDVLKVVIVNPGDLSIWELQKYITYLRDNGLDAKSYQLALWNKLIAPLTTLVMLLFAVPFAFGPLRSAGSGQRIVVGVLIGVGFYLFSQILGHLGQVYGLNPLFSAAFPPLLFFGAGVVALYKLH